jgi:tRNA threonylcarbamoyladenosine biosynthesis protein TsaB
VILALDTSTRTLGIALHDGARVCAERVWTESGYRSGALAPEVALVLRRAAVRPAELRAIGVALGPGSFTGLRIGLALAHGLATPVRIPVIGVPTLEILARGQPRREEPLLGLLEAGRGRAAGQWFRWRADRWEAEGDLEAATWEEWAVRIAEPAFVSGELDARARTALAANRRVRLAEPAEGLRRPSFLAEIAWERMREERTEAPDGLELIYLDEAVT